MVATAHACNPSCGDDQDGRNPWAQEAKADHFRLGSPGQQGLPGLQRGRLCETVDGRQRRLLRRGCDKAMTFPPLGYLRPQYDYAAGQQAMAGHDGYAGWAVCAVHRQLQDLRITRRRARQEGPRISDEIGHTNEECIRYRDTLKLHHNFWHYFTKKSAGACSVGY